MTLGDQPRRRPPQVIAAVLAARARPAPRRARDLRRRARATRSLLGARRCSTRAGELRGDAGVARAARRDAACTTFEAGHLADPDDIDTPETWRQMPP